VAILPTFLNDQRARLVSYALALPAMRSGIDRRGVHSIGPKTWHPGTAGVSRKQSGNGRETFSHCLFSLWWGACISIDMLPGSIRTAAGLGAQAPHHRPTRKRIHGLPSLVAEPCRIEDVGLIGHSAERARGRALAYFSHSSKFIGVAEPFRTMCCRKHKTESRFLRGQREQQEASTR
jgi:hypothetical protein